MGRQSSGPGIWVRREIRDSWIISRTVVSGCSSLTNRGYDWFRFMRLPERAVGCEGRKPMSMIQTNILTIVIPALNEEDAIGGTITRCLDARESIKREAGLGGVEIIVVSDGSTDRTVEIARGFEAVKVIVFEKNRGYGAAIKEGFRQGTGELVGFLDADGTCDPVYFGSMCRLVVED